ncbi:MAG: MBL fold metallo-hydrolase [Nitrospirota bacterium]
MIILNLVVGPLENNCFIIGDEKSKECFIVDPGDEPERILAMVEEKGLTVKYIVCTHAHFDHIAAVSDIWNETRAGIVLHRNELEIYKSAKDHAAMWGFELDDQPDPSILVSEGDSIQVGGLRFEVLHTPGHSPGGICLYGEGVLITGDTLFSGSVGRTDLHGGNIGMLKMSFRRLMALPDEIRVLPGHGPETTIGKEKVDNFFSSEI